MSLNICKSCKGEYESVLADGSDYYHTCPPQVKPEHRRDENAVDTDERKKPKIKAEGNGTKVRKG